MVYLSFYQRLLCTVISLTIVRGTIFKKVKFEGGDTVIVPLIPIPFGPLIGPYHKVFALSRTELLQLNPSRGNIWMTEIKIVGRNFYKFPERYQPAAAIKPDPTRQPIGPKGILLARRLAGLHLPYHSFTCNCYHYTDYLTYGRTFGEKWSTYPPISDACPLHLRINSTTNVISRSFQLEDKKNNKFQLKSLRLQDFLALKEF
nr:PREDICTED: uncharacterized protein LOC109044613 [Bemisia tabaci]